MWVPMCNVRVCIEGLFYSFTYFTSANKALRVFLQLLWAFSIDRHVKRKVVYLMVSVLRIVKKMRWLSVRFQKKVLVVDVRLKIAKLRVRL